MMMYIPQDIIKDRTSEPQNLGAPYNSGYDDFAFFMDTSNENSRSYLSSNRPGGKGNDDIYTIYSEACSQTIKGIAREKTSKEPLLKSKHIQIAEVEINIT